MTDELYINGKDAYTSWGIGLESGAIATLLMPAPMKDYISNSSRLAHGTQILKSSAKINQRDISLQIHLMALSESDYLNKYNSFVEELKSGQLVIFDKKHTKKYYRCYYSSCTSYSHNINGLSKFTLKLTEPDPTDRNSTTTHTDDWNL